MSDDANSNRPKRTRGADQSVLSVPACASPWRRTHVNSKCVNVDPVAQSNRRAWEAASEKYVREHEDQLAQVARGELLLASELDLLRPAM